MSVSTVDLDEILSLVEADLGDTPSALVVAEQRALLQHPLRIAIAGRVKAGKSTVLNALVGERLAPTDAGECTRIVTSYSNGPTYDVSADLRAGGEEALGFDRVDGRLVVELGDDIDRIERLRVRWPSARLATSTLIDTPGVDSVTASSEQRSLDFLKGESMIRPDAVLYLMTHVHERDIGLLDAFAEPQVEVPSISNTLGVLTRADEIAVGRHDALDVAATIATSLRDDARVRRRCANVIPLAGLLAETAVTLREDEYAALWSIARLDPVDVRQALRSVDRFTSSELDGLPPPAVRAEILRRFGMFGLRLAAALIAGGTAPDSSALATELQRRSGLDTLRDEITTRFAARTPLLRQSAALTTVANLMPQCSGPIRTQFEAFLDRANAESHPLAEIRALDRLANGIPGVDPPTAASLARIFGGNGADAPTRLGLHPGATPDDVRSAAIDEHARWRERQSSPTTTLAIAGLAELAARSCEGIVAGSE